MRHTLFATILALALPLGLGAQEDRLSPQGDTVVSQDRPCAGQPRTYRALRGEYEAARPRPRESLTGTWVLIGSVYQAAEANAELPWPTQLNCDGLQRVGVFEHVLVVERDSVTNDYWYTYFRNAHTLDAKGSLRIYIEEGGDDYLRYHCRRTRKGTLACIEPDSHHGLEFMRMNAPLARRPSTHLKREVVPRT